MAECAANVRSLIDRSIRNLAEKNMLEVWQAGIHRDPTKYHITVMYPPLKTMEDINENQIFGEFQNPSKEFTLYVHIPFCSGKCTFCYFYQIEKPHPELVRRYLSALKREIAIVGEKIRANLGEIIVKSVFFGGGSPTMLSSRQFTELMSALRRQFQFADSTEITVEIHPEIVKGDGRELLDCYRAAGVNRLNIGVQSFHDPILQLTNRRHTSLDAVEAYHLARRSGFSNINIDLLYPLPDLTPVVWEETLHTAFQLGSDSVTTYFTAIREKSPIHSLFRKSPQRFPNEVMNHLFRIMSMEKAREAGYKCNELIDWFVKPRGDFHYEHQKAEATQSEEVQLLSFGSGVFTYLNYHQYYNIPDIGRYCDNLEEEKLPIWKGVRLSRKERLSRAMVLGIKSGMVDIGRMRDRFKEQFLEEFEQVYEPILNNLQSIGLLEKLNGSIQLSEKGVLFADEIAVQFASADVKEKLRKQKIFIDPERDQLNSYNFMYDIDGICF